MQETSSLTLRPQALSLSEFLTALFQALDKEGLRPCVLRNYEGFPSSNVGSDVDFLIRPSELPRAIRALRSVPGIRVVGYAERHYVAHVFVEGISPAPGIRALGLDFIWSLSWKGLPYLATDAVLQAAIPRRAGDLTFLVPSPVHEAIISLLSSLLIGGWLKEKYFPKVQETVAGDRLEATAALVPGFGIKAATRLVDSVIGGERQKMLSCVRPLRTSLVRRSFLYSPLRSVFAVARYHLREFVVRCTPATLETIRISGLGNATRTTIVDGLIPMLQYAAKTVEKRHFGTKSSFKQEFSEGSASANSCVDDPSGSLVRMTRIARWVVKEWLGQFKKRANLTLRLEECCHFNFLVDTQNCRRGLPKWFLRLVEISVPSCDLWLLLDGAQEVAHLGSLPLPAAETLQQREANRAFVKTRKRNVILSASRPAPLVMEEAYAVIIETLAQRTGGKLNSRF